MAMSYYVKVDVNGEEVFWVDKTIFSSFSGRFNKLFSKPYVTSEVKSLKVILHGLPGGAEAFELVARFCYNKGKLQIIPANACLLYYAAHFMEMAGDTESIPGLIKRTEKHLMAIACWTWSEMLIALRQCQSRCLSEPLLDKLMDSVVERVASTNETSLSNSSPESSGFRFSFDTRSTMSRKQSSQRAWWFEDLVLLNLDIIDRITKMMLSKKVDHGTLSKFLLYYLKTKTTNRTSDDEKRKTMEVVIDLLFSLERTSISYKGLFTILHTSSSFNISQCCRSKLEGMIGYQLDRATLDNIIIPTPIGMDSLYDAGLVLRFCKSFLRELDGRSTSSRLKMVANLMDLYLAEVAPDPSLKPKKFVSLAMVLPDEARVSYDGVYRAIDMYIEVHARLSEEARMRICRVLNYEKLSTETCKHLAQNSKLPSRTAIQALVSQQSKLKTLLQDNSKNDRFSKVSAGKSKNTNEGEKLILYAKKLGIATLENEKLQAHLQGMQREVFELEKMCRKMQTQMTKIVKTGISSSKSSRSLPRLCS